jgi:hypothetical protein
MSSIVGAGVRDGCTWGGEAIRIKYHRAGRERSATYPEDPRRVDDDEVPCELGLVRGYELPSGTLGERLRGEVDQNWPRGGALTRHRRDSSVVPVRLVVIARCRVILAHRGNRGGEDYPPDARAVLQRGVQDRCGPPHGGDDELCAGASPTICIFLAVRHTIGIDRIVVEGRGGVGDGIDALDSLVKGAVLRDILDDDELEALAVLRELFFEKGALGQRADGAADRIPGFEVFLHGPHSEIAVGARDEDFSRGRDSDHLKERERLRREMGNAMVYKCSRPG